MGRSREKGKAAEELASRYLKKKGYAIIARNFTSYWGEIDIVAYEPKKRCIVFVEVRSRSSDSLAHPADTVTRRKRERIIKTALTFLSGSTVNYEAVRFDVVAVLPGKVIHLKEAFTPEESFPYEI